MIKVAAEQPRSGWWTGSPYWGSRYQGALPVKEGDTLPIGNTLTGPGGPPQPLTIALSRTFQNSSTLKNSDVRARFTVGVGGQAHNVEVDWAAGSQFTILANTISLQAVAFRPDEDALYEANTNQVLGVMYGVGSSGVPAPATYTTPIAVLEAGAERLFQIPPFARSVFLFSPDTGYLAKDVRFYLETRATSRVGYIPQSFWAAAGFAEGALLPGTAAFVRLTNMSGTPTKVGLSFLLGL